MKTVLAHRAATMAGCVVLAGSASAQCTPAYLGRVASQTSVLDTLNSFPRAALDTPQGLFAPAVDPESIARGSAGIPRFVQGRWRVDPQQSDVIPRQMTLFRGRPYLAGLGGVQQFIDDRWVNVPGFLSQNEINAIAVFQDLLLVAGNFEFVNDLGETVRLIGAYDGTRWRPFSLPTGAALSSNIVTLSVFEGDVYTNVWTPAGSWHRLRAGVWETLPAPGTIKNRVATLDLGESLLVTSNGGSLAFDGSAFTPVAGPVRPSFIRAGDRAVWDFQAFDGVTISTLVPTWFTSFEVASGGPVGSLGGEPVYVIQGQTRVLNGSSLDLLTGPTFNVESPLAAYQGQAVGFFFDGATGFKRVLLANPISSQTLPGEFVQTYTNPTTIVPAIASSNEALYVYNQKSAPLVIDGTPRARIVRWTGNAWASLPELPIGGDITALLPEADSLTVAVGGSLYTFRNGAWDAGVTLPAQTPVARLIVRDGDALAFILTSGGRETIRRFYRLQGGNWQHLDDPNFQVPFFAAAYSNRLAVANGRLYAVGVTAIAGSPSDATAWWNGSSWTFGPGATPPLFARLVEFQNSLYALDNSQSTQQLVRLDADLNVTQRSTVPLTHNALVDAGSFILGGLQPLSFQGVRTPTFFGCPCPGDFNLDRIVDDTDFAEFAYHYNLFRCQEGPVEVNCRADLTGDGFVDDNDFVIFAQAYGSFTCP